MINNNCIACDACLPACPNQAIFEKRSEAETNRFHVSEGQGHDNRTYVISHERCTECVGHFNEPQGASVYSIDDCCVPDPAYSESKDTLLERARRLHPHKELHPAVGW